MKKLPQQFITGQLGVNIVERRVFELGWIWNATRIEAGIDGYIEIRDPISHVATNLILQVQSKATEGAFAAETDSAFEYICSDRDLEYWMGGNTPVILIISRPSTDEAYWVSVKDYFKDPSHRATRRVRFIKADSRFDGGARERLQALAVPRNSGLYLGASPREETLFCNLLPVVRTSPQIHVGHALVRDGAEARRILGRGPDEWILKRGQLYAFADLADYAWRDVVDAGTVEAHDISEWRDSSEGDRQNEFRELLFHALRARLRREGVGYFRERNCFFFTKTPDRDERRAAYKSLHKSTDRAVVMPLLSRKTPGQVSCYRHSGFEPQFLKLGENWYLSINPTYHFTSDGFRPYGFYESKLKGIKSFERNQAVLGQVVMWSALLQDDDGLFADARYEWLGFGPLVSGVVPCGINEDWWLSNEEDDSLRREASSEMIAPLFDGLGSSDEI